MILSCLKKTETTFVRFDCNNDKLHIAVRIIKKRTHIPIPESQDEKKSVLAKQHLFHICECHLDQEVTYLNN